MQSRLEDFEKQQIRIVAISTHSVEELGEQAAKSGITFELLADPEAEVIGAYGSRHENGNPLGEGDIARPSVFWIDENGQIIDRAFTDNWRIRLTADEALRRFE